MDLIFYVIIVIIKILKTLWIWLFNLILALSVIDRLHDATGDQIYCWLSLILTTFNLLTTIHFLFRRLYLYFVK